MYVYIYVYIYIYIYMYVCMCIYIYIYIAIRVLCWSISLPLKRRAYLLQRFVARFLIAWVRGGLVSMLQRAGPQITYETCIDAAMQ